MSDERMPRQGWREAGCRLVQVAAAGFLLACAVGLFYVGVLAWHAGRPGATEGGAGPKGLPIVVLAALTALGATALIKSALLPSKWSEEEQL